MPDILIRGISLAECFGKTIEIGRDADGDVFAYVDNGKVAVLDVAELPPHGDLIDRSDVFAVVDESYEYGDIIKRKDFDENNIPAIVPAERRESND